MFWKEYQERVGSHPHEETTIDKAAGFAILAGVAAVGVIAGKPYLNKFKGLLASGGSKVLGSLGLQGVDEFAGSTRAIRGNVDHVINNLLSDSSLAFSDGLQGISSRIISDEVAPLRARAFVDSIRADSNFISTAANGAALDQATPRLIARVHTALRSTSREVAERHLLDAAFLDDFPKVTQGVMFQAADTTTRKQMIRDALKKSYDHSTSRKLITEVMTDDENKLTVLRAIRGAAAERRGKERFFDKFLDIGQDFKEIALKDVFDESGELNDLGRKIDEHVKKQFALKDDDSFLDKVRDRFHSGLKAVFGDSEESLANATPHVRGVLNEFEQEFMGQPLGLFYSQRSNALVSKAQLSRVATARTKQVLDEIQVPLFPGYFNVRISRLFGFMREDGRLVRDLGKVMAQGELRRAGVAIDPYTEAFGVGSKILTLDPQSKKLTMLEESFRMLPKRMSRTIEETARNRVRMVRSVGENLQDIFEDHPNIRASVKAALAGSEHDLSLVKRMLAQHGDKLFEIGPPGEVRDVVNGLPVIVQHPDQVALVPKQSALLLGIDHLALNKLFGDPKNVPISELSPRLLQQLLSEDFSASTHVTTEAAGKLLESASTTRHNIGRFLSSAGKDLRGKDLTIDGQQFLDPILLDMMEAAESPGQLWDTMYQHGLFNNETADWLQETPDLFAAVEHAKGVREDFVRPVSTEGGLTTQVKNAFFGEAEHGKLALDVHAALLKEVQSAYGILALKEAGMNVETASQALRALRTDDIVGVQANPLMQRLSKALGLPLDADPLHSTKYIFERVLNGVTPKGEDKLEFNLAALKKMAGYLDNFDVLRATEGYDALVGSKILHTMYGDIKTIQNQYLLESGISQRIADRMRQLTHYSEVAESINHRFTATRWWTPEIRDLTEAAASNYYLVPRSPALQLNQNLGGLMSDMGGRIRQTVGSLMDPHAARGPMGYLMTVLGQMPGRLGAEVGLGLQDFDKVTLLRTFGAVAAKRVLPLVVGYELYKNINADADNLGLPGLDDLGANLLANVNRTSATIKDALGLTGVFQSLVYSVPGLDQYFSPRSEQEYEDYLAYGDEAVRKGRGWLIGSRSSFTGGGIDFYRPNFYRRWRSGWTSADNVDLANPNYSFLPTLTNPLAPLNRLLNPGWWVHKHLRDRPYRENGIKPIEPVRSSNYIYVDSSGAQPMIGEFGRSLPPTMVGGETVFDKLGIMIGQGGGSGPGGHGPGGGGFGPGAENPHKLHVRLEKPIDGRQTRVEGFYDHFAEVAERYRQQAGLYGAILNVLPWPGDGPGLDRQEVGQATGWSRMFYMGSYGEALGPLSEFYRRFIPMPDRDYNAYSPYTNNMPTWLPQKFRSGDPYTRVPGQGEMSLPGDAWERLHPWFRPLKVRGSMIGLDESEIIQKLLNPEIGEENEYLEFGTYAHLHIQRQLRDAGLLVGAEVPIYDSEDNISGTLDAIIRGASGPEVLEIKTQNAKAFARGETPDKYFDQLNFYLHATGLQRGQLAFVNSEDPTQVRFVGLTYDPDRYERMMEKITGARSTITDMVEQGVVSPYETYDILARLEVLSNVAPNSPEFNELMSAATRSGGFGGQEKLVFEQIKDRAKKLKERYNLYPHRSINTETHNLEVLAVNDDGTFTTEFGTFRLAGLEFDRQAFSYKDPDQLLAEHGIVIGKHVPVTVQQGLMNERILSSTVVPAIVGRTNRGLIQEGAANPDYKSRDPMDSLALRGEQGLLLGGMEWFSHSDFMLQNKFFRVRSGVEQFERGEVFGTDYANWRKPFSTMVVPTLNSMIAKDPIQAGLQGGFIASLFARSPEAKLKVGAVVGGLLMAASTARMIYDEADPNHPWTPKAYREQAAFDEYYDALEYVKETAVAEAAKDKALYYEGVNVDLLNKAERRVHSAIGPYSILAIEAEKKARRTMYAYDAVAGSLQDALAVIPDRQRQIAEDTILHGTLSEKHRLFTLLPRAQKRVLGSFLGESGANIPERPSLTEIFSSSYLPRPDWEGWSPLVDMADIETVAEKDEGLKIQQPSPERLSEARSNIIGVRIPNRHHPTAVDVRRRLNEILAHGGLDDFEIDVHVATASERAVNVNFNIGVDRTDDFRQQIKDQIRR